MAGRWDSSESGSRRPTPMKNNLADLAARRHSSAGPDGVAASEESGFAFDYDAETVRELDAAASGGERLS
jgi:hypothetical protein